MTFPPPPPAAQNSIPSGTSQNPGARAGRAPQSVWSLSPVVSGTRRALASSLSTDLAVSTAEQSGPPASTIAASPFASTFSSVVNSSNRTAGNRTGYLASSSAAPYPPLQAGSQQPHPSQILSPRSRNITPSDSLLASSAAASTTVSQGGGVGSGSGGGAAKNQTFSPSLQPQTLTSPTNPTFDRSAFTGTAPVSLASGQSSVSKIVVTQVFLLLGSITEKEGKAKWESQAEAIRKV